MTKLLRIIHTTRCEQFFSWGLCLQLEVLCCGGSKAASENPQKIKPTPHGWKSLEVNAQKYTPISNDIETQKGTLSD